MPFLLPWMSVAVGLWSADDGIPCTINNRSGDPCLDYYANCSQSPPEVGHAQGGSQWLWWANKPTLTNSGRRHHLKMLSHSINSNMKAIENIHHNRHYCYNLIWQPTMDFIVYLHVHFQHCKWHHFLPWRCGVIMIAPCLNQSTLSRAARHSYQCR